MAKHYGYKLWEIRRLTLPQLKGYLENLEYVLEWSKSFGQPPPPRFNNPAIIDFAEKCGIKVPDSIKLAMAKRIR